MEKEILKKATAYFGRSRHDLCVDFRESPALAGCRAVSDAGSHPRRFYAWSMRQATGKALAAAGAYPLLILALTHLAVLAGVAGTARAITLLCLQLPAGALADLFDRRLTMIICDSVRAFLLAVLGILIVAQLASWPVVLIVSLIEGGAGAIFDPAAAAALPGIVPDGQLEQAWAATEARTFGAALACPRSAGCCSGWAGPSRSWPTPSPTRPRSAR